MPLIKDGKIVEDLWEQAPESGVLPEGCNAIVTLSQWQDRHDELRGCNNKLGIILNPDDDVAIIADDLDRFGLVVLSFPAFTDGRAFSQARLLKERFGFKGELRADGPVIPDQYQFLDRCGFDSVTIADGDNIATWEKCLKNMASWYQPTGDGRRTIIQKRAGQ